MGLKLNGATDGSIELNPQDSLGSDRVITLNATGNSTLTLPDSDGTLDRLERAGNILQVVQNYVTSTSSLEVTAGTMFDIPVSTSITPTYSSSKILVRVRWSGEFSNASNHEMVFRLKRNGTVIGMAPTAGSRGTGITAVSQGYWNSDSNSTQDNTWFEYLDSPNTTASITYQLAGLCNSFSATLYTNRTVGDIDNINYERLTSSITLMEVAG